MGIVMRKIVLLCSTGLSTGILVKKIKEEAKNLGYECEIEFYPLANAGSMASDADVILLAPQVRSSLGEVKSKCPNVKVTAIDAKLYSVLDAVGILDLAQKTVGDY